MIGWIRPRTTITALMIAARSPLERTARAPRGVGPGEPLKPREARQEAMVIIIPTKKSKPPVRITRVWAMATYARTAPLLETEVKTLVDSPFDCCEANRMNMMANTRKLSAGPALRFQNRLRFCKPDTFGRPVSSDLLLESAAALLSPRLSEALIKSCSFRSGPLSSRTNLPP